MNLKSLYLLAGIGATLIAFSPVGTPEATAKYHSSGRSPVGQPTIAPPANPTPTNTVTGKADSNISSGPAGANVVTGGNANGSATSPTNASTNSTVNLFKDPGGLSTPPIQVKTIRTKATQTSAAGGVTGTGSSQSQVDAQVGSVTFSNTTQGTVTGAKSATINATSGASLNTGTGLGAASGNVDFKGSN